MFTSFKELHKFLNIISRHIAKEMDRKISTLNQDPQFGSTRDYETCFGIVPINEINNFLLKFKMILSNNNIIDVCKIYPTKRHLICGFINEFEIELIPFLLLPEGILFSNSVDDKNHNVNIFMKYSI